MTARVIGARQLLANIQKFGGDAEQAEKRAVFLTANQIKNTAIRSIQSKSPGKTVTRQSQGGGTYKHVAASAGNAPNTDTGDLVKSINTQPLQPAKTMYVGVNAEHGVWLEFGTRKMLPRPFMQPAITENQDELTNILAEELRKLLK